MTGMAGLDGNVDRLDGTRGGVGFVDMGWSKAAVRGHLRLLVVFISMGCRFGCAVLFLSSSEGFVFIPLSQIQAGVRSLIC